MSEDPYRGEGKKCWLVTLAWNTMTGIIGLGPPTGGGTYYETLIVYAHSLSLWYAREQKRREEYDRKANEAAVKRQQEDGNAFFPGPPIQRYTGRPFAHIVSYMRIPPEEAAKLSDELGIVINQD